MDRRRALLGLALVAWATAIALFYFRPSASFGLRWLKDSSLPELAVSGFPLAALRLLAAASIFAAAWGMGRLLLGLAVSRGLRAGSPLDSFLAAIGLGLGALMLVALALSPLGLLRPAALLVVLGAGVVLALAHLWRIRPTPLRPRPERDPLSLALLALIAAGGVFALIAALAPETEYDAVWYHLEFPRRYLEAGSLVDERCEYVSLYPMGAELLFGYGLALGSAVVAKLVSFGFWVLFVLATLRLGTRLAGARTGLVAAAIAALAPTVLWEASTAYVDLACAFFVTLSLAWVLRALEERTAAPVVLAGLFGGIALAVKIPALLALLPLGLIVLLATRVPWRTRAGHVALFGAAALVPAAPWLVRAEIEGGNPVFPSLYGLFGADPDRWSQAAADSLERSHARWGRGDGLDGLLTLPWDLTMHGSAFAGALGVLFLMLVPAALTRRLPRPVVLLGLFAVAYVVLWASPPSSQQVRFLLPVVAPLAVLAAIGFERARELAHEAHPALAGFLVAAVLGVLALSLPPFTQLHDRDGDLTLTHVLRGAPLDVVSGAEGREEYLRRKLPAYAAARSLADGGPVAAVTDPYTDFYAEPELIPDHSACLRIAGARRADAPSELRALARLGVRRLLLQRNVQAAQGALEVTRTARPPDGARVIYEDERALVYELRPAK